MSELQHTLHRVQAVAAEGRLPVMVFDLDSTLFNTAGRHLAILRSFAEVEPVIRPIVDGLVHEDFSWRVDDPLRDRGFHDEAVLQRLTRFWFERFFHDDWLQHDLPNLGAVSYVQAAHRAGALVYYLTGRHVGGMERGTMDTLLSRGFPVYTGRTLLHLKPDFHAEDKAFKKVALDQIRSFNGEVVATFENEPGNANLFLDAFPEGDHFLVGNVCSPDGDAPADGLIVVPDFLCD